MTTDPHAWDFDTRVGAQSTPSSSSSPDIADTYNRRALRAIAALADACWTEPTYEAPDVEAELVQLDALLAAAEKLPLAAGGGQLRTVVDVLR